MQALDWDIIGSNIRLQGIAWIIAQLHNSTRLIYQGSTI